jgi:hypothetical protein
MRCGLIGASIALFTASMIAQESSLPRAMPLDEIVRSVERAQTQTRPQVSYQVIREYRLFGAQDSKANSEVVAEVNFKPPAFKDYKIQTSSGSGRGQQLVRRVLDQEVEAKSNQAGRAITRENYDFDSLGEMAFDGHPCYVLGLRPKRKEKELISGRAWIDQHSFMVRQIEGEVAKTPSWWLKQVHVKLVFAEFEGIRVQTSMEAIADVRIAGAHTLTSHMLDYRREDQVATGRALQISTVRKR